MPEKKSISILEPEKRGKLISSTSLQIDTSPSLHQEARRTRRLMKSCKSIGKAKKGYFSALKRTQTSISDLNIQKGSLSEQGSPNIRGIFKHSSFDSTGSNKRNIFRLPSKRNSLVSFKSSSESETNIQSKDQSCAQEIDKKRSGDIKSKFFSKVDEGPIILKRFENEEEDEDKTEKEDNVLLEDLYLNNSSADEDFLDNLSDSEQSDEAKQTSNFLTQLNKSCLKKVKSDNKPRKITIDCFEIIQHIKSGGFGQVFLAKKKSTGDVVAIKKIPYKVLARKNLFKFVTTETQILSNIDNSYAVRCYFSFADSDFVYFVMEYLSGGDLELYLEKGPFNREVRF